jgi:transcriptional regulator with XRE-family HTH domain
MPTPGSTVVRRQLGVRLRRLRDAAGKTDRDVEEANLASRAKLWRIETGKVPVKVADVRALCWLYGADHATTDALAGLAVGTTGQGWWEDYSDLYPFGFSLYLGLESTAAEIRTYHPEVVHGLLQTPDYMRALYWGFNRQGTKEAADRMVELRLQRQLVLTTRVPPPRLTAVVSAGTLARLVGGPDVMAEQEARLRELSTIDHIDVRVIPWEAGAHAAIHLGPVTIFDLPDPDDPAVVYVATGTGARYLEKPAELAEYRRIYDLVYQASIPIEEYPP